MMFTFQPEPYTEFLDFMNLVFTAFFAFEFVVKFAAFGLREYVKDPWNNFDFIIVIGSFLDIIMAQVRVIEMMMMLKFDIRDGGIKN